MKYFLTILSFAFSISAFAEAGFDKLEKLYDAGQTINIQKLQTADKGMYVGRCFTQQNDFPLGGFAAFKNLSQDSGPIAVDPLLYIAVGSSQQSNYFDEINVKNIVDKAIYFQAYQDDDKTYQTFIQGWAVGFRQNGEFLLQKNSYNGMDDSYCYFYSFRAKK
jgi:hypothetical protein